MNENKFDGMGAIYAQYRPAYPNEFIDSLYNKIGFTEASVIADIGSGTGILTKQLLERGSRVYAVEPNADMREEAKQALSDFPGFVSVSGSAEHTTLPDKCVDFITSAQAFHWFDPVRFKAECARILVPGGNVVLAWNTWDEKSALVAENERINETHCPDYDGFSGGILSKEKEGVFQRFFSGQYETADFQNDLSYTEEEFIGRSLSVSYAPKRDDENFVPYVAALRALFARYGRNGRLRVPNFTRCFVGRV